MSIRRGLALALLVASATLACRSGRRPSEAQGWLSLTRTSQSRPNGRPARVQLGATGTLSVERWAGTSPPPAVEAEALARLRALATSLDTTDFLGCGVPHDDYTYLLQIRGAGRRDQQWRFSPGCFTSAPDALRELFVALDRVGAGRPPF